MNRIDIQLKILQAQAKMRRLQEKRQAEVAHWYVLNALEKDSKFDS